MWKARTIAEYGLRAPKYLEFKADDGTTLYGRLLLPPDAPASGKIPVIVHIYGGPAAQMVRKGLPDPFDEILARKGFAIFAVDNRGTPGRDRKFQTAIRHEFGAVELKDQLTALDQLLAQYPQLDKDRIAIWGWSNGGSMTLYAMTHSERFRRGRGGGSGDRSGELRHDLHRALHGPAQGRQGRVRAVGRDASQPTSCTGRCCWCMARATTMCTFRTAFR